MTIVIAFMLVVIIALGGICFYLVGLVEEIREQVKIHSEWQKIATGLLETISTEQDKGLFRLKVAEERILNLQNRTGQIQIKLRQMDNNTIYEVKHGE
ncbi:MAG: hypothetical protein IKE94_04685 [Aeriscardovia sp.]|nr:hypothetical protein [Aeriscardovia sp.]